MAQISIKQVSGLLAALNGKASSSLSISAGAGLTGGGDLTASRTLSLTGNALGLHNLTSPGIVARTIEGYIIARQIAVGSTDRITIANADGSSGDPVLDLAATGVSPGAYTKVTVDAYGRVVSASNPSTMSGLGITDGLSASGGTLSGAIIFSDMMGSGLPTVTTRTAGARLVLKPTLAPSFTDIAIGYQANNMWFSIPDFISGQEFMFFGGNRKLASLSGDGHLSVVGTVSATLKSFVINHPTKKGWKLQYTSLEGPENGVYCRGRIHDRRDATIVLPEHWHKLVDHNTITVHITSRNRLSYYIKQVRGARTIVIASRETDEQLDFDFDYVVFAERKDVPKLVVERPG